MPEQQAGWLDAALFIGASVAAAALVAVRSRPSPAAPPAPPPPTVRAILSGPNPGEVQALAVDTLWAAFPGTAGVPSPVLSRSWPRNTNFICSSFTDYTLGTQPVTLPPGASPARPAVGAGGAPARLPGTPRSSRGECDGVDGGPLHALLTAGLSPRLFFNPAETRIAIATAGGLCPGLNTVIREVVMCAVYVYGVAPDAIFGVPDGYRGFYEQPARWRKLAPADVSRIHLQGGTVLGSSRGGFDAARILAALQRERIDIVVLIGGDGTHRGAAALCAAARAAGARLSVACVPKTVDDDLPLIDRSFGFQTAVEEAVRPINCAHTEAHAAPSGVGLVKLMGRSAGFIALHASLASRDVNACLLPESPWRLARLCEWLEVRLAASGHAVIVVAEGAESVERAEERAAAAAAAAAAGAPPPAAATDASGNPILDDVGEYLRLGIAAHFKRRERTVNIKYISPSYEVRAAPANAADSDLCAELAFNAVHGAMAGLTAFTVGVVENCAVWLPVDAMAAGPPRRVDVSSRLFARLMSSTGQPCLE